MSTTLLPRTGPDTDEQPRRGRNRKLIVIGTASAVVLAGVVIWLVAFSSVLGVGTVRVRGSQLLTARQVRHAAGIADGTPLVRLDTDAVRRRVERLPEVASARVATSFPSSVTITVTDRTPVGYVQPGARARLVDRDGKRYRTVAEPPSDVPRLVLPGAHSTDSAHTARAVAGIAAALPAALRAETSSIQALSPQAITVVLDHGRVVQWGSATRNAEKARVLPVLLRRHDMHIDVTDPDQPFTR